jgi:hypothetical protein
MKDLQGYAREWEFFVEPRHGSLNLNDGETWVNVSSATRRVRAA